MNETTIRTAMFSIGIGAVIITLILSEIFDHFERVKKKRASCYHGNWKEFTASGHKLRECGRCGVQQIFHGDRWK